MKPTRAIDLAIWLLEHLTFGSDTESVAGDLLEEFQRGRSAAWCWREALAAMALRAVGPARDLALVMLFSVAWSMAYTLWRVFSPAVTAAISGASMTLVPWPGPAVLQVGSSLAPILAFVWSGVLVYLFLRSEVLDEYSLPGLAGSLSASFNVLLAFALVSLNHFRHPQPDLHSMSRGDFYSVLHVAAVNLPVALSVFTALLFTVKVKRPNRRGRRSLARGMARRAIETLCALLCSGTAVAQAPGSPGVATSGAPTAQLVTVAPDVRLEVLDWGGSGRPLIFLAGLGNDAHVFDRFAPQFTAKYHVYGITRRGFGGSSAPEPTLANYSANRLGDDVLAVIDALHLVRPVLIGHSLAGEELSSVASRHPEKVAGLIYLDAAYGYAFYDSVHGDIIFDFFRLKRELDEFMSGAVTDQRQYVATLLETTGHFQHALDDAARRDPSVPQLHAPRGAVPPVIAAINLGAEKFAGTSVPTLAIFACPHNFDFDPALRTDPTAKAAVVASDLATTARQADAFAAGVPSARVVRIPNADHYVFRSNAAEVAGAMNSFLETLP